MAKSEKKRVFTDLTNPFQRFRSQTGMSQVELAAALGLGQPAVSAYERGAFPGPAIAKLFVDLAKRHKVRMDLDEVYERLTA